MCPSDRCLVLVNYFPLKLQNKIRSSKTLFHENMSAICILDLPLLWYTLVRQVSHKPLRRFLSIPCKRPADDDLDNTPFCKRLREIAADDDFRSIPVEVSARERCLALIFEASQ